MRAEQGLAAPLPGDAASPFRTRPPQVAPALRHSAFLPRPRNFSTVLFLCAIQRSFTLIHNYRLGAKRALRLKAQMPFREPMILQTNVARTFAALSATNEAILYAKSPEELYRRVCGGGDFGRASPTTPAGFLPPPGRNTISHAPGRARVADACPHV